MMQKNISIFLIFSCVSLSVFSQSDIITKAKRSTLNDDGIIAKDSIAKVFEVYNIERIKKKWIDKIITHNSVKRTKLPDVYLIEFINTSSTIDYIYPVISLSYNGKKGLKITKGKNYSMLLIAYFDKDYFPNIGLKENIYLDEVQIKFIGINGLNLYTTPNLEGLYYIPPKDE